jgi:hypothetical protein
VNTLVEFLTHAKANADKILTDLLTAAVAIGAVLAVLLTVAPSAHLPAQYVTYLTLASSVVAAGAAQLRRFVGVKAAAKTAAK